MDNCTAVNEMKRCLTGVVASIMQTPDSEAKKIRLASNIVVGKTAGFLTTSVVYGLASSLGTAGTGTAISTLSGAAATNATMALIGKLVGGGMAAGALLLPAIGILAGFLAVKGLSRKSAESPRNPKDLHPSETEIVFCAISLLRPMEALNDDEIAKVSAEELAIFVNDGMRPLLDRIEEYCSSADRSKGPESQGLSDALAPKFQNQLRGHSRQLSDIIQQIPTPTFERKPPEKIPWLLRLWRSVSKRSSKSKRESSLASAVLALTFRDLLDGHSDRSLVERELLLDALRSTDPSLTGASFGALAEHVRSLDPGQIKELVFETKRRLFTHLLKRRRKPKRDAELEAMLREAMTEGCDLEFLLDGKSLKWVEIRKSVSSAVISEHLARQQSQTIQLTEQMIVVVEAIANPHLQSAVFNQKFFQRLRQHEEDGALSEVTDDLLDSALIHAGVIVFNCLSMPDDKRNDHRELIERSVIAVVTGAAVDAVAEVSGLSG